ncbi:MAG: hypothetical protein CMM87_00580 [Rickettsiales bacterium]|nr:hypothetical protein [Rickettsiales bacterium]
MPIFHNQPKWRVAVMNIINFSFIIFTVFLSYSLKAIGPDPYSDPLEGYAGRPSSPIIHKERRKRSTPTVQSNNYFHTTDQDEQSNPPGKRAK